MALIILLLGTASPVVPASALSPHAGGGKVVCAKNAQCRITAVREPARPGAANSKPQGCVFGGRNVACRLNGDPFNSASGCYEGKPATEAPDGPVAAQQEAYGGTVLYATCPYGGTGGYIWQPPTKPAVSATAVRAEAVRLVPSTAVGVAPKDVSLVNVETVLWVDAPPRQTLPQVTLLGQRVVITLELDGVNWRFGDGETAKGAPAGKAYDARNDPCKSKQCEHYYGHTYRRTGKVTISATASWRATFSVDGGAAQSAGIVSGPTGSTTLNIKQARGVLVPNPGE